MAKSLNDPFQLEARLEHKIKDAGYLIPLVLGVMLWTAGFVDLLSNVVRALDSALVIAFFAGLVIYSAGFGVWWWLIVPRHSLDRVKGGLAWLQRRPALAAALLVGMGLAGLAILEFAVWDYFPLLGAALLALLVVIATVILVARPQADLPIQMWRKVALGLVGVWIVTEAGMQLLAALRVLPVENLSGLYVSHGRVYQNSEGFANASTNRQGWYAPEFRLASGSRRIVLTGDTYVLATQVDYPQHMAQRLTDLLNASDAPAPTEVLALGFPGYGMAGYAEPILFPFTGGPLKPDEVVVVFHLANDFQTVTSTTAPGYYIINDEGRTVLHPDSILPTDVYWHATITGYEPLNPLRVVRSQAFTLQLIDRGWRALTGQSPRVPLPPLNTDSAAAAAPFGASSFMFAVDGDSQAEQTLALATGQLLNLKAKLAESGIRLRLVTLPYFPREFYVQANEGADWSSELGDYDLLKPERELQAFAAANAIDFLPMGAYLRASGMSAADIQGLFFREGVGHLTVAGHQVWAEAIQGCLYDGDCPLNP